MSFVKNQPVAGFSFGLVSATNGGAVTSGSVAGYVTLDGGTQVPLVGTPVHEGNGQWSVDLAAGEMDGDVVGLIFIHAAAVPVQFTIKTSPATTSTGQPAAGDYLVDLIAARDNIAAQLADLTANPKPSYSIDGQWVDWDTHFKSLAARVQVLNDAIAAAEPYELHSTGTTS